MKEEKKNTSIIESMTESVSMCSVASPTQKQLTAIAMSSSSSSRVAMQSSQRKMNRMQQSAGMDVVDAGTPAPRLPLAAILAKVEANASASSVSQPTQSAASANNNSNNNNTFVSVTHCNDPESCVTLADILKCFNAAVSEEQAWALIYQSVRLYRDAMATANGAATKTRLDLRLPTALKQYRVHRDGSVHMAFNTQGK